MSKLLHRTAAGLLAAGLLIVAGAGCAWSVGSPSKTGNTQQPTEHPTTGQELIDLKRALDQGAITPEEYEAKKQRLLEQ
ncbi:MAG: SHOCT domain-containing protein [Verrucomicrobiales bacterium]|nr:SHOCT domain-containing protein [Verrucomicrobiales bacterium]